MIRKIRVRRELLALLAVAPLAACGETTSDMAYDAAANDGVAAQTNGAMDAGADAGADAGMGPEASAETTGASASVDPTIVPVEGYELRVPGDWNFRESDPTSMVPRLATFRIPPPQGVAASAAEMTVYRGIRGGAAANAARWANQLSGGDSEIWTAEIAGIQVTRFEGTGTFDAGMPGSAGPQADWMVLGAILEAPGGEVFVKATGPRATLEPRRDAWNEMVEGIRATGE